MRFCLQLRDDALLLDVDLLRFLVEASCSMEPKNGKKVVVVVVACCFLFFICCLLSVTCLCTQTAYLLLSHRRLQCEQGDFKRKTPVAIVHVALLRQVWYHLGRIRRTSRHLFVINKPFCATELRRCHPESCKHVSRLSNVSSCLCAKNFTMSLCMWHQLWHHEQSTFLPRRHKLLSFQPLVFAAR